MTLPVIIISTRAAIRAIPDSIREGALALGATHWQVVWDCVLPLSLPGILTGTIIGLARAIGETAPLLIIGMMAYIPDVPSGFTSAATVLPTQIYTWSSDSIRAFTERTSAPKPLGLLGRVPQNLKVVALPMATLGACGNAGLQPIKKPG